MSTAVEEVVAEVPATAAEGKVVESLIHVSFNPDGTVALIGERPQGAAAQAWFKYLSHNTLNRYQALAGGRGLFRIPRPEVDALKAAFLKELAA
ncbi:hypothetical protein [Methylococcus sp. EFPC2]|uniref:hypothetical protein n=1 Tax=Methylococcus sp. EFPC2 TaxID=2812648 RepID=UPI0019677FB8|nr:hypothetical protein [Methylococcus sp. EFPC2]QSA99307.1 hypothetical protein JWZ97_19415 [Methylococcus sp. EFPC2]